MPLPSPSSPRRRLSFKRLLLALVLGLAAWWGVGWWLSPRPLYTLRFPNRGGLSLRAEPGSVGVAAIFYTSIHGEYSLVVQRPNDPAPGRITLELFDLPSGRSLRSLSLGPQEFLAEHRGFHGGAETGIVALDTMTRDGTVPGLSRGPRAAATAPPPGHTSRLHTFTHSRQSVREIGKGSMLPPEFDGLLDWLPWLASLMHWERSRVGVWDDELQRFLWSLPVYEGSPSYTRLYVTAADDYVVVDQGSDHWHAVQAYRAPAAAYSPWWSRAAGLLVAALVLFARCRRRGLSGA